MNALFGYVEDILIDAVLNQEIDSATKKAVIRALNKLLWIQNDLFTRHYIPSKQTASKELSFDLKSGSMKYGGLLMVGVAIAASFFRFSM